MRSEPTWLALTIMVFVWVVAIVGQNLGFARIFFEAHDRFADFIVVVFAVPHGEAYPPFFEAITRYYAANTNYLSGSMTIYHLPPFSMLLTVLASKLFTHVSPVIIYLVLSCVLVASLFRSVRSVAPAPLAFAAIISYPVVFMLDRGNLYAGLCGACLVAALVRGRADWVAAILLAIALNIRPNVAPMVLPLLVLYRSINWRFGFRVGFLAIGIGLVSAFAAHALYPEYTLTNFHRGMDLYLKGTLNSEVMLAFGSSLYSALFVLGSPSILAAATTAVIIGAGGVLVRLFGDLNDGDFIFVCASVMALGSAVFVDYHMIVFIVPLIMAKNRITFFASFLLLLPKGFGPVGYLTTQVLVNPAIMIVVSPVLILSAVRLGARRPAHEGLFAP